MNRKIKPLGLKGVDVVNRVKDLMFKTESPQPDNKLSSIEFIKHGPDNITYGVVRENHTYFIKTTDKKNNITENDFRYIGGLQNKLSEAHRSYADALKHLNMKFDDLNKRYGVVENVNIFETDDNDADSDEKGNPWAICTSSVGREDEEKYESCVQKLKKEYDLSEDLTEDMYEEKYVMKFKGEKKSDPPMDAPQQATPSGDETPQPEPEIGGFGDDTGTTVGDTGTTGFDQEGDGEASFGEPDTGDSGEDIEFDEDTDDDEDPIKYVQKLTGKLAQKMRDLSDIDLNLEKYVINSVISASHVDQMEKKDKNDIVKKIKKSKHKDDNERYDESLNINDMKNNDIDKLIKEEVINTKRTVLLERMDKFTSKLKNISSLDKLKEAKRIVEAVKKSSIGFITESIESKIDCAKLIIEFRELMIKEDAFNDAGSAKDAVIDLIDVIEDEIQTANSVNQLKEIEKYAEGIYNKYPNAVTDNMMDAFDSKMESLMNNPQKSPDRGAPLKDPAVKPGREKPDTGPSRKGSPFRKPDIDNDPDALPQPKAGKK